MKQTLTEKEFKAGVAELQKTSRRVFGDHLVILVIAHSEARVGGLLAATGVVTGKEEAPGHWGGLLYETAEYVHGWIAEANKRSGHSGLS
jgi:pyruvoyl-dependent arginine decarboxylase (PvlArgDC)